MIKNRSYFNSQGFSLLEVIVSAGIISIGALALGSLTQIAKLSLDKSKATESLLTLKGQVGSILINSGLCAQAFAFDPNSPTITLTEGATTSGLILSLPGAMQVTNLENGVTYGSYKINSISLILPNTHTSGIGTNSADLIYQANLVINLTPNVITGAAQTRDLQWPLTVILNSSNKMKYCGPIQFGNGTPMGLPPCISPRVLQWDGVSFSCRTPYCSDDSPPGTCSTSCTSTYCLPCPQGYIQYGFNGTLNNPNCIKTPVCQVGGSTSPAKVPVFIESAGTFQCKQVYCPKGYLPDQLDTDGFIISCRTPIN